MSAAPAAEPAPGQAPSGYDPNLALMLAHQQLLGAASYWLFVLDDSERLQEDLDVLVKRLPTAAAAREAVCISGPDPLRNRTTLEKALARMRGRDLMGLTVVYLGPQEDQAPLQALLQPSHADLRYVVFPVAGASTVKDPET